MRFTVPQDRAIAAYKGMLVGLDHQLYCAPASRKYHYEVGQSYHEPYVKLCASGFHCCLLMHDVLRYFYNYTEMSYAEVRVWGKLDVGLDKIAAERIHILKLVDPCEVREQEIVHASPVPRAYWRVIYDALNPWVSDPSRKIPQSE